MKKLIETLRSLGIEVPEAKEAEVKQKLSENYKNTEEVKKTTAKLETERDSWKERAETAETTLKGFEGIDPAAIQNELATWKKKAEDAQKDYESKIAERDFEDALKIELENMKFTSDAAKKSVVADIRAAGLKLKDGKILGLNDLIAQMREKDASAFVDEQQQNLEQNRARFTQPLIKGNPPASDVKTKDDIMKIKDPVARQAMIAQHMDLF